MGRPPRIFLPGYPHHVVQRGHNRNAVFVETVDYQYYLSNLHEWKTKYEISVNAYCLMTNHIHLVLTPQVDGSAISSLMRRLSAKYGRRVNRLEDRLGTVWCGRFKSSLIDSEEYLFACIRYVEMNPVRAGIVCDPVDYEWSSFRERMGLARGALLLDSATGDMGADEIERRRAYQAYAHSRPSADELDLIRGAVKRNQLTGGSKFVDEIERRTGIRIEGRARGRPRSERAAEK